jgi:predicted CXXCH cytochrome family protein
VDCHDGILDRKVMHPAVDEGTCSSCHTAGPAHLTGDDPSDVKTDRTAEGCYACHDRKDQGKSKHAALSQPAACLGCHDPHGSDHPGVLKKDPVALCSACHAAVPGAVKHVHGALRTTPGCSGCHDAHASPEEKLLRKPLEALCLSCHGKPPPGSRVETDVAARTGMAWVHAPVPTDGGGCGSCHLPHGSAHAQLLKASFSAERTYNRYQPGDAATPNTYALCFDCHDAALLDPGDAAKTTGFRHDVKKGNKVVRKNLHRFHVVDGARGAGVSLGRSCRVCHEPHGAEQPHGIRATWPVGAGVDLRIEYRERPQGGECTRSCHAVRGYTRLD